jgi:hypothetical protein
VKILVTGSREFTDRVRIATALEEVIREQDPERVRDPGFLTVIHGGARGADTIAGEIAAARGCRVEVFPPAYDRFGPEIAPFIRNSQLVGERPDLCLAFYSKRARNSGTRDCVAKCRAARIPVREYERP